ncbi:thioredoxin [Cricetulus griseus]|uniref:Thioredoxin n=1 Tax=Cricetulus griseus TaxID=10029 RepID=A0A061II11_CRIGR|nr:thioredoxin [Cricetulus griseus]
MAQRLLLRRFLTSAIPRKPPQSGWTSLTSRALQTPQYNPGGLTGTFGPARTLYTTRVCSTTFNVQDGPDFQDRVVNSETPVVVDFHAHYFFVTMIKYPNKRNLREKRFGSQCQMQSIVAEKSQWQGLEAAGHLSLSHQDHPSPTGPRLEKMVAKQHGKVVMAKVDIDDHTDLAIEYEVSAVPTVLAIKNGDVVDKFVGIKDEDQLEAFLKKLIG